MVVEKQMIEKMKGKWNYFDFEKILIDSSYEIEERKKESR